ncbi:MAG: T9SS type A sorting domain-containing protein [Bacteroidetes bacterium]|nr:T9SS type A sorting domain-containing protein [Bacteroidota bacterium]
MKAFKHFKIELITVIILFALFPSIVNSQYTIVDDQFFSDALGTDELVDIWLPPGYYDNPMYTYPVIYLLHSAADHTGGLNDQNGYEDFLPILNQMIADGEIDPFIIVKPNGQTPPYAGSCWYNSDLYGNYEDMVKVDLINYIEANYRVLKGQDFRYILGHSYGGHAAWSMSIRHPDLFAAVADIAGYKNMAMTTNMLLPNFLAESGGTPPYSYSPVNGQLSVLVYTLLGAYNANLANPPFYVNMFLDANGDYIPAYYDDWLADDIYEMIPTATQPANTQYWFAHSPQDMVVPYPSIAEFKDRLDQYNWDYTFFPFDGGHYLVEPALEEAFRFIDGVWKTKEAPEDYSILIEDIEFQPGVTIDINVNVYVNENATNWADHGKIFAIEGMAHTANCMKPFAEALFTSGNPANHFNEFYAIDMPGRGGSGLPEGLNALGQPFLLDQMYIEDYLEVIQGAIAYLNDEMGVHPNTIMGHSLGGLEVILLQQKLIDEGTNLRKAYKFKNAVLLAPAVPGPLDWAYINGGGSAGLYDYIDYFTSEYGTILNIPYYIWPIPFFSNTCCYFPPNTVPGAPTPEEVLANGYKGIEPAPLLLQISGSPIPSGLPYPYKPRPEVDPNIFAAKNGVQLTIISDEFDRMMTPAEEMVVYEYLSGDMKHKRLKVVLGDETCHDTHISDPHALVELLDSPVYFKSAISDENVSIQTYLSVFPNPVKDEATLHYALSADDHVNISMFTISGSKLSTVVNAYQTRGTHEVLLETQNLKPGMYILKLNTGQVHQTVKLLRR